ncbi:unnamed protein product [Camellia sinensis]
MPFKRYVEIGRVALVNYGKDYGRLVVIVDVLDQNRALVDAPDMVRCQMNFKRLSLTDITIDIKRVPKKKTLVAAMEAAADVKNKWENSSWGRKLIVQKRRAALNDFDRFKLMLAKIKGWSDQTRACKAEKAERSLKAYIYGIPNFVMNFHNFGPWFVVEVLMQYKAFLRAEVQMLNLSLEDEVAVEVLICYSGSLSNVECIFSGRWVFI